MEDNKKAIVLAGWFLIWVGFLLICPWQFATSVVLILNGVLFLVDAAIEKIKKTEDEFRKKWENI